MRRGLLLALFAAAALAPASAQARGPRGGTVMTPFGPVYNTNSPEWKAAGGNPIVYQQIMEQKMMMQQQQMLLKQQQQMLKAQQQNKKVNGANGSLNGSSAGTGAVNSLAPAPHRKKKRRTYDPTHPVTSSANKTETTTVPAASGASKTATKP